MARDKRKFLVPLADYERMFRVLHSVYEAAEGTDSSARACIFFAVVGAEMLRRQYKIGAAPVAGAMAVLVHRETDCVNIFGRLANGTLMSDSDAFHCWIEAHGIVIDFIAPLYRGSLRAVGVDLPIAPRMFQKSKLLMSPSLHDCRHEGDFFVLPNPQLSKQLFEEFASRPDALDLAKVCLAWYIRPPKSLRADMAMMDDRGEVTRIGLKGPKISSAW